MQHIICIICKYTGDEEIFFILTQLGREHEYELAWTLFYIPRAMAIAIDSRLDPERTRCEYIG